MYMAVLPACMSVHVYIPISLQGQHHIGLGHVTMTSFILSALMTPNTLGAEILGFRALVYGCGAGATVQPL